MRIKEIYFKSFDEFAEYTSLHKDEKIRLYRGQERDWPLDSKVLRLAKRNKQIANIYELEKQIFHSFKNLYQRYYNVTKTLSDFEILSIGQHYGLPTRLLDWSMNPNIALWFAFEGELHDNEKCERIVWGLVVSEDALIDFQSDELFEGRFVKVFKPNPIDERIINQESWFSIQPYEITGGGGDMLPVFNNYHTINHDFDFEHYLIKFKFKESLRFSILTELNKLGINYLKVFPDIAGLCQMIEWNEIENVKKL